MKFKIFNDYFIIMENLIEERDFGAVVIGDCHFGTKTNSKQWLDQQIQFFREQVMPYIKMHKPDEVIFLGDLFDIRYSTNTLIGIQVKELVEDLCKLMEPYGQVIFVAGNHDYYTPKKEDMHYNSYEMVFGEEFSFRYLNCVFVTERPWKDKFHNLFLPWYYTEDIELYAEVMEHYKDDGIQNIFCHSDLQAWDGFRVAALNGKKVFSGHIHYPTLNEEHNLYTLGACCAFNFNDVNSERYFYHIVGGIIEHAIPNCTTPSFIRYYNQQIFSIGDQNLDNCFVQLYIDKDKINKAEYIEEIKNIKNSHPNVPIRVVTVDEITEKEMIEGIDMNQDIKKYISSNIPSNLYNKYEIVRKKVEEREK